MPNLSAWETDGRGESAERYWEFAPGVRRVAARVDLVLFTSWAGLPGATVLQHLGRAQSVPDAKRRADAWLAQHASG